MSTTLRRCTVAQEDRFAAAASARLRGLDDAVEDDGLAERDASTLDSKEFGFHVDDPDTGLDGDEPDVVAETDTDVVDALAEAFNARDLDALLDVVAPDGEAPGLLGGDRDHLPDAVESLWHRRPTCCLTRGRVADEVVGVLWEHDGAAWWALATVHIADVDDDGIIGVLEFTDDPSLLEEVEAATPGDDLEEGSRWEEWDEGAD
jgi:hypothetical protein